MITGYVSAESVGCLISVLFNVTIEYIIIFKVLFMSYIIRVNS